MTNIELLCLLITIAELVFAAYNAGALSQQKKQPPCSHHCKAASKRKHRNRR